MGSFGLSSLVFGDPRAALGAFGRPLGLHLSPSGLHWGASGASLASICRLRGSIWTPLGVIGIQFWIQLHFFENLTRLKTVVILLDYFRRKNTKASVPIVSWTHYLWVQMEDSKKTHFPPKTQHRFGMHICKSKGTSHKFVYQTFESLTQFSRYQSVPPKSILK